MYNQRNFIAKFLSCRVDRLASKVTGPLYNGKFLHSKIKDILGKTKLHETLTNVVIPTFDVKKLQPMIFSTFEVRIVCCEHYRSSINVNFDLDYNSYARACVVFSSGRVYIPNYVPTSLCVYSCMSAGRKDTYKGCPPLGCVHRHICSSNVFPCPPFPD